MEVFKLKEGTKLNIEQTAEDIRCMTVGGPLYIGVFLNWRGLYPMGTFQD